MPIILAPLLHIPCTCMYVYAWHSLALLANKRRSLAPSLTEDHNTLCTCGMSFSTSAAFPLAHSKEDHVVNAMQLSQFLYAEMCCCSDLALRTPFCQTKRGQRETGCGSGEDAMGYSGWCVHARRGEEGGTRGIGKRGNQRETV